MATDSSNDIFAVNGDIAMVEGLASLPQRIKNSLSLLKGESPLHPDAGSRLKEYFDSFEDSPWLQQWVKLEVIRMACVPYNDRTLNQIYTLLPSIRHVDAVEQLVVERNSCDWLPFRFKLDVAGVGPWEQVIPICVPRGEMPQRPPGWDLFSMPT